MSEEDKFSIDNIETKTMSILYANIDKRFSQYSLFDKLIRDKFPENYNTTINPIIKAKFLLVLRNLASRFDDIEVTKETNVFYVTCFQDIKDKSKVVNYVPEPSEASKNIVNQVTQQNYLNPNLYQSNRIEQTQQIQQTQQTQQTHSNQTSNLGLDYIDLVNYIIDNDLDENINYVDPFDGNTIFHDLVATNNLEKIKKLVEADKFDYQVKNKYGFTPIELTKNIEIIIYLNKSIATHYMNKMDKLKNEIQIATLKVNQLDTQVQTYKSEQYKKDFIINTSLGYIIWLKALNVFESNKLIIISLLILFFSGLFIF